MYSAGPGVFMRTLLQRYSANKRRKPRRFGTSEHALGLVLALRSGRGAKKHFFLNYTPPPHPTIKPSQGWLQVGKRNPLSVVSMPISREISYGERKDRRSGGGSGVLSSTSTGALVGQGPSSHGLLATALGFWSGRALTTGTAWAGLCLIQHHSRPR